MRIDIYYDKQSRNSNLCKILHLITLNLFLGISYFLFSKWSLLFHFPGSNVTPLWLPSGLSVGFILVFGKRFLPGVFLGAYLANYYHLSSNQLIGFRYILYISFLTSLGNTFQSYLVFIVMERYSKLNWMFHLKVVLIFLMIAFLSGLIAGLNGTFILYHYHIIPIEKIAIVLYSWCMGDFVGIILISPILYSYFRREDFQFQKKYSFEYLISILSLLLIVFFIFRIESEASKIFPFLFFPITLWVAFRSRQFYFHIFILLLSGIVLYESINQRGPFAMLGGFHSILCINGFITILSSTMLIIKVVLNEREISCFHDREDAYNKIQSLLLKLKEEARTDYLTGALNRRALDELIINDLKKPNIRFCIAIVDIDNFKQINDIYGHLIGDEILKYITQMIDQNLDKEHSICRWGGDEYLVYFKNSSLENSENIMNTVITTLVENPLVFNDKTIPAKISIGLTEYREGEMIEECFKRCDEGLYKAKLLGKGRVIVL